MFDTGSNNVFTKTCFFDGIVAFQAGFEAWREVVGADGIEPSVEVHEGGSGSN
jgi:hypothetical protein